MNHRAINAMLPIGRSIVRVGGLVEGEEPSTRAKRYAALLELDDGNVALLRPHSVARLAHWPAAAQDMPVQDLTNNGITAGDRIVRAVILERVDPSGRGDSVKQLLLILQSELLVGLVPVCGGGTKLHVEDARAFPAASRTANSDVTR